MGASCPHLKLDTSSATRFGCRAVNLAAHLPRLMRLLATLISGFFVLLRNKAKLGLSSVISVLSEFGGVARIGAVMRAHVAEIERQLSFGHFLLGRCAGLQDEDCLILQADGAARKPSGFGHVLDVLDFFLIGGLFGFHQAGDERVEVFLRFVGKDVEVSSEAVFDGVSGDDLFAGFRDRTGRELSVVAVGCELGGRRK